jgi:hypothetical protein
MESIVIIRYDYFPVEELAQLAQMCGKSAVIGTDEARMAGAALVVGDPVSLAKLRVSLSTHAMQQEKAAHPGASLAAVQWLATGERGLSSEALFTRLSGLNAVRGDSDKAAYPRDPSDLRRCRLMLEAVPELDWNLPHARDLSPVWARLIDGWDELELTMDEETPNWRDPKRYASAPRTYALMQDIIHERSH